MKKILSTLILSIFLAGCGSTPPLVPAPVYTPPPPKQHLTLQQVINNTKITKTKFDEFEKYETAFFQFDPNSQLDWFLFRGWENAILHQIYIKISQGDFSERMKYEKQISGVKFVAGKLGGELTKIKNDKKCRTVGGLYISGSVNKYNRKGRFTKKSTYCEHFEIVGINVTTDMLKSYRNSEMEFELTSREGNPGIYSIPAVYVDGYLKALGL